MRVIAIAAITADGKIARHAHQLVDWSSREDKRLFAATSREAGVIVMGKTTFDTIGKPLKDRLQVVLTRDPGVCPPPIPGSVEYASGSPAEILAHLSERGFETVIVGGGANVYRQFIVAHLVDELWLTVEPLLFGAGVSLLGDVDVDVHMRLSDVVRLAENTVQLRYTF